EQIDYLRKEFGFSTLESSHKVYVIEQAETMNTHAANRLLKFLEEPTLQSTAILLTDNSHVILPTIRSRCQIIDLKPLDEAHYKKTLLELTFETLKEKKSRLLSDVTTIVDEALEMHAGGKIY